MKFLTFKIIQVLKQNAADCYNIQIRLDFRGVKFETKCMLEPVKYSKQMKLEDLKRLLKMRDIISIIYCKKQQHFCYSQQLV